MTVAELIEELKKMPQDIEVYTEGCDCDGDVTKVSVNERLVYGESVAYLHRSF